ncbi:MAG TPA: GrpB family protein [Solirubrobacterales bacterium]|nr:GrpB family protein [Solirubrobacterales bacterium]
MELRDEAEIRPAVEAALERERQRIARLLPGADVQHIGSTAIPGSLTKGDLDILVRVAGREFAAASPALSEIYEVHQPEEWQDDFASFALSPGGEIAVGVQLVVEAGESDRLFLGFRDLLRSHPELRDAYNQLKNAHRDDSVDSYREAKAKFIGEAMGDPGGDMPFSG